MKKAIFLAATALALVTAAPYVAFTQETGQTVAVVGKPAPDIQVNDWINGDGRTSLADFKGEVVFLELWATH